MLTDVFHKRYPHIWRFYEGVPHEIAIFLRQGAQIIFQDLKPHIHDIEKLCYTAYSKLVRELGHGLYNGRNAEEVCDGALCESYDLWNNAHGESGQFVAYRLSLLELLMAEVEAEFKKSQQESTPQVDKKQESFRNAIQELNHRLREAIIPFHYHNGILQGSTDNVTESHVHEPFWVLVQNPKWGSPQGVVAKFGAIFLL
jgi:hypothetical protein